MKYILQLICAALLISTPVYASRTASGVVYPASLDPTNGWVDIGWTSSTNYGYGSIRIDGGSHWYVGPSRFNIQYGSAFTVDGSGTEVDVELSQSHMWLIDGTINVQNNALLYSRLGFNVGDTGTDRVKEGRFTVSGATARGTGTTLTRGEILVENGGLLDSAVTIWGSYDYLKNNRVTVDGNGSEISRYVNAGGGELRILNGGRVLQGGYVQGYYADDPTRIARATISGDGSCWGSTNTSGIVIYEGGECSVEDGGAITSSLLRVGLHTSTNFVHTAKLMITGANSRVSTYYRDSTMNGAVEVGETSPGRVDVCDGATLNARSIQVYSNGAFYADGSGTMVTSVNASTVSGRFVLTNQAAYNGLGLYVREPGSAELYNASVSTRYLSLYGGTITALASTSTAGTVRVGQTDNSRVSWSGGSFTATNMFYLGDNVEGIVTADSGALLKTKNMNMGANATGCGFFGLTNGQLTVQETLLVGSKGRGAIYVGNDGVITAQTCYVASDGGSYGLIDLTHSKLQCSTMNVISNGVGELRLSDGSTIYCPTFTVAQGYGTGSVTIAGSGSGLYTTNAVNWGAKRGSVRLLMTNGAELLTRSSTLQEGTNSEVAASLYGTGTLWQAAPFMYVEAADMTIADGAEVQTGDLSVYEIWNKAQSGYLMVNGGRIICTNIFRSSSRFAMSNSAYVAAKDCEISLNGLSPTAVVAGAGTILTNSGTLSVSTLGESHALHIRDGAKVYAQTAYVGSPWGWRGGDIALEGADSLLQVANSFSVGFVGGEEEERSTTRKNDSITNCLSLASSEVIASQITIKDSGMLSGNGTLRGPVVNGGQVDPGTVSAGGSLLCSSGYQQTSNGILHVDLFGVPALDSYDVLQSSGDVTVDGVLQVNISGWTPAGDQDFQIISAKGTVSGTFDRIEVQGAETNQVSYLGNGVLRVSGPTTPASGWLRMYGTNEDLLVSGAAPSKTNGTDFGAQTKAVAVTNVFSVLNASNGVLTISAWTEHDPDGVFEVVSAPDTVNYLTQSNVFISFKPLTGGVYSAYIEVTSTSPDSPFILKLAGSAKDDQVINFQNPGEQIATNVLSLTGTASSHLPVSYTVSSPGVLDGSSLSFIGSGSVTVTAQQAGNEMWNPAADVKQVFNVTKAEQAPLVFQPASNLAYMSSTQLTLTGGSGTGLVVYSVLSGPAELQGETLTITNSSGTVVVQALKKTDAMYLASTTNATITADRATQVLTLPLTSVRPLTTNTLNATSSSGLPVSYELLSTNAVLTATNQLYCPTVGVVDLQLSAASNAYFYGAISTNQIRVLESSALSFLQLLLFQ